MERPYSEQSVSMLLLERELLVMRDRPIPIDLDAELDWRGVELPQPEDEEEDI